MHSPFFLRGLLTMLAPLAVPALAQSPEESIEPSPKQVEKMQAITPEAVARSVVVKDDDLEPIATFVTADAYQNNGKFTDRVRSDNMLRAFLSKATGRTTFQVYQSVTYGAARRDFTSVNYATPDGPLTAELTRIGFEVLGCGYGTCSYKESVGFNIDEAVLRAIASQYVPGNSPFWRFRFKAQNGLSWDDRMMPAEVAGLLRAVDAYRAAHSVK
jgi:hypothetical protein